MTRQFRRPQSLLIAARENLAHDLGVLLDASVARLAPTHRVRQEVTRVEGRVPTVEEALAAIKATFSPTEDERAAALRRPAHGRSRGPRGRPRRRGQRNPALAPAFRLPGGGSHPRRRRCIRRAGRALGHTRRGHDHLLTSPAAPPLPHGGAVFFSRWGFPGVEQVF